MIGDDSRGIFGRGGPHFLGLALPGQDRNTRIRTGHLRYEGKATARLGLPFLQATFLLVDSTRVARDAVEPPRTPVPLLGAPRRAD